MCKVLLNYNQNSFRNLFLTSDNSPSGLCYKEANHCKGVNFRDVGDNVGTLRYNKKNGTSAWYVKISGKAYAIHRIVWFLAYGEIDATRVIDHVDGDPTNNKLDNLRLVDQGQNNRNAKKDRLNTSGISGVHFDTISNRWCSIWAEDGRQRKKSFSVLKYGQDAKTLAIDHKDSTRSRLGYSEGHGL